MINPISRWISRSAGQHGPIMLMYHALERNHFTPTWPWTVTLQAFERQLDFLREWGWRTITQAEMVSGYCLPDARNVVITFDDGYVNNLQAVEALEKRGMCATFFIVSGSIGCVPDWAEDGRPPDRLLCADELRAMRRAGMEIGSHSVSHRRLTRLDDSSLRIELTESRRVLHSILGEQIRSFAYPYGDWDARCAEAVRQAGYSSASTTRTGWAIRDRDPFSLRRLTVFNTDTLDIFSRKLALGSHDVATPQLLRRTLHHLWRYPPGQHLTKR